ncbi:hypothetical protein [Chryseobacterium sp. SIMBA_038]|uniref:hypothetical protein n=4 Tax=Pseudomonadati TaxID=3379134 RepID=UPI00397A31B5
MYDEIIKKLEVGPAVLMLGQKYLSLETGVDPFLKMISKKYNNQDFTESYSSILEWNISEDTSTVLSWMYRLSKSIPTPEWITSIAKIPWSSVYTSAFDTIPTRAFEADWRTVQPIYDEKYRVSDPRDKTSLHITYLFGGVDDHDINKRPPLKKSEYLRRKPIVNGLLNRLPTIISPKGVLIIDGYDLHDELPFEDLASILYNLGPQQALLCSCGDLLENEIVQDLVASGKLLTYPGKFSELLNEWVSTGTIGIYKPTEEYYLGRWLTLSEKRINIPQEVYNAISKTATIIDDETFNQEIDIDDNVEDFRKFLSNSNAIPAWFGYPKNYAFKRTAYKTLKQKVLERKKDSDLKDIPIIFHGQSSSGKTTSLGLLAYELRTENYYPVLYIEKRYQKIDETEIDKFCIWLEQNGAKQTIIIWDGMQDRLFYEGLLKKLNTRGRNIVLVGSSYSTTEIVGNKNAVGLVELPIALSAVEKTEFQKFLRNFDPIISNIISGINETNFLAMMYRYIPEAKGKIFRGLAGEYEFFTKILETKTLATEQQTTQLYDAMQAAGFQIEPELLDLNHSTEIGQEMLTLADQLIFSVMVPGKFGLNVPFELLLQIIGFDTFYSSLFKVLNEVDIIKWYDVGPGELLLGPRTALEATILSRYLGKIDVEVSIIKLLLRNIRLSYGQFGEPNYQIQFAIDLLDKIGPNSDNSPYRSYFFEIAEELKELRETGYAYHPRLILKEAFFLRELVKKMGDETFEGFNQQQLLDRAGYIVTGALEELNSFSEKSIHMFLTVELGSIYGTKAFQFAKNGNPILAKQAYFELRNLLSIGFASNPENYGALDVIAWSTMDLLDLEVFDEEEKLEVQSDLAYLFERAEVEAVSERNQKRFDDLRLRFNDLIKNEKVAESVFEKLKADGHASGFYMRAKSIIGLYKPEDPNFTLKNQLVYAYLEENFNFIKNDSKCLFLLFKSWWFVKTQATFFTREKQTVAFSEDNWRYCLHILEKLEGAETNFSTTTLYIKAIAQFHLGLYIDAKESFTILETETSYSFYGGRRIKKFYLASNSDGTPKRYSGRVRANVSAAMNDKRGTMHIPDINMDIPFLLYDFRQSSYQRGDRISSLYIAFNFRGPVAIES